jgi:hypothetical protein
MSATSDNMIDSTINDIQKNIDRIIEHLEPSREFINMHLCAYLCDDLYEKHVPDEIKSEINCIEDVLSAIELFLNHHKIVDDHRVDRKHQNLYNYILKQKTFYIENLKDKLYLTTDELLEELSKIGIETTQKGLSFRVKEFMSEKKNHEVEIASKLISTLSNAHGKEHFILDIGDGKGYLSSRLALEYNLRVLGVDGNSENTIQANSRNEKLKKWWPHLLNKEAKRNNSDAPSEKLSLIRNNQNYRTISSFIYEDTDLDNLIETAFPNENINDIMITSLHACGNLSSNVLRNYVSNDKIKLVMLVGCCYNLLFEEFETDYFNGVARVNEKENDFGFPMSNYLRSKEYRIGRNARMLGTQSMERILNGISRPDETLIYRAIFEKLIRERWRVGQEVYVFKLGKIRRVNCLEDYLKKACEKLNISFDLTSEEIRQLEVDFAFDREKIQFHYYLRLLFAKIIETLINLDRYLYLLESKIHKVYVVKIFDEFASPRNFSIISIKD